MLLLALIVFVPPAGASCEPAKMVRIVYRITTPGIDPQSPDGQPETLYRLGPRYARIEGAYDAANNVRPLMVVNEPDVWMVNLLTSRGRHMIDPGADEGFRAPVVGEPDIPDALAELEFGCEVAFMKAGGGAPKKAELDGRRVEQYERKVDKYRLVLAVSSRGVPVAFTLHDGSTVTYQIRYQEYEAGLTPRMELFEEPKGVAYRETVPEPLGRQD
jgi:hypothetical protein